MKLINRVVRILATRFRLDNYLSGMSAISAYKEAGYKNRYAGQNAYKLLQNTVVKDEIDRRLIELKKNATDRNKGGIGNENNQD